MVMDLSRCEKFVGNRSMSEFIETNSLQLLYKGQNGESNTPHPAVVSWGGNSLSLHPARVEYETSFLLQAQGPLSCRQKCTKFNNTNFEVYTMNMIILTYYICWEISI